MVGKSKCASDHCPFRERKFDVFSPRRTVLGQTYLVLDSVDIILYDIYNIEIEIRVFLLQKIDFVHVSAILSFAPF